MKQKIIIAIIVIVIIIIILINLFSKKNTPITSIKTFHFSYTTSTAMNSDVIYEINCDKKICQARIKLAGMTNEEFLETQVDKKTKTKIEKVLKTNEVEKWDGFNKSDKYVLDGNSFDMSLKMTNNEQISASGYMKWPPNYSKVKKELDLIFKEVIKDNYEK